jgi:maltose/moltooligosaccharide transporter
MESRAATAPSPVRPKPRLAFWEIWNMSFGFLGIQFGFALQNANVSRIFETLGASVENIPILWIAAPATSATAPGIAWAAGARSFLGGPFSRHWP